MNSAKIRETPKFSAIHRFLPFLLLLFAGSGCSALIYEIVWFQLLQLVVGSSAVSLAVLLGIYMGGMCLGSLALPRVVPARHHPLRVYAFLEFSLGVLGFAVLYGMPYFTDLYAAMVGDGMPGVLGRSIVCGACLLPPTVLMGATLPAIARWIESTPRGIAWLGFFYGGNIAGAVFGCLLAGFYLLRVHDMATATYVAAAINGAVGLLSLTLALVTSYSEALASAGSRERGAWRNSWSVYVAIAISGACALAAEGIWTRGLSLMLGPTVYTFSIILAVFLIGLGLGSSVGSALARTSPRPKLLLGGCQLLLAGAIAWTAYMSAESLPYWPINPYLARNNVWLTFQLDLVRCLYAILPATFLWGASFPLALAAGASKGQDQSRLVGGMYAANTVGAIIGAIAGCLFLIRFLGTQQAQQLLIGVSGAAALLLIVHYLWSARLAAASGPGSIALRVLGVVLLTIGVSSSAVFLTKHVPPVPWELIAFGRSLPSYEGGRTNLYMGEGLHSSVAVTQDGGGVMYFHISGKVEASSGALDMRLQRMLGHLPALFHPKPRTVLVVGCGAGVTAGTFLVHPDIEKVVICELEPLVPQAVATYFSKENYGVVNDPRVQIVYDDARHFILTTPQHFDIITSDPIHPWVKGSATLYTKEYFELCKQRLNPGGLITQWVPLYESDAAVVKSEFATFFDVFSNGSVWSNDDAGQGYDVVLLGKAEPLTIDADQLQDRLDLADHKAVVKSLEGMGCNTVVGLLATYAGQARDLAPWLEDAEINFDRNLRLQYLAGMQLNIHQSEAIYDDLLRYRQISENIFVGDGWRARSVRLTLERAIAAAQKKSSPEP